jgi:hypothetical protein
MRPPTPEPEAAMPIARLRFVENQGGKTAMLVRYRKPIPIPKQTPCVRKRCQILVAYDAPKRAAKTSAVPRSCVKVVPVVLYVFVTNGPIIRQVEIDRPPMNA